MQDVSPTALQLAAKPGGNARLNKYVSSELLWTFARLVGVAGTADTLEPGKLVDGSFCVAMTPGATYGFGNACGGSKTADFCEANVPGVRAGVWCGICDGACFRPADKGDGELSGPSVAGLPASNTPTDNVMGFRVYVGP